jgi:hypothetical protein
LETWKTFPNASGAEVGRTGGEVTQVGRVGVIQFLFELAVDLIDGAPGLLQLQAGPQRLHPQMIFLIDHHTERFLAIQHQAAAGTLGSVFAADQMAFHQNIFVQHR